MHGRKRLSARIAKELDRLSRHLLQDAQSLPDCRIGLNEAHVRRLLRFAFLAPDLVAAIVEGRQRRTLTVKSLLRGIPLAWHDQRQAFGI
jgi:hypothetical protein